VNGDPINMLWIIAVVLVAIVALAALGAALHLLLSPWLWVAGAGVAAWLIFRPRRSRR
jgi:purine-cytosine permease-like protein